MKTCFKCGEDKPEAEFYRHSKMNGGFLGKCKQCTKADTREREARKMQDPEWREKELLRHRLKSERQRATKPPIQKPETKERWKNRNPEKRKAQQKAANAVRGGWLKKGACCVCGNKKAQAHHDDYTQPLAVMWLCTKHHAERHIMLRQIREHGKPISPHGEK